MIEKEFDFAESVSDEKLFVTYLIIFSSLNVLNNGNHALCILIKMGVVIVSISIDTSDI